MNQGDVDLIKRHEGYRPKVYKDHLGFETIGIGFKVSELYLDEEICDRILVQKLSSLELRITQKFDWYANSHSIVKSVVLNMCYQMGLSGFSKFKKTIKLLSEGELYKASIEMLDSKWAKVQTPERAKELSRLLNNNRGETNE